MTSALAVDAALILLVLGLAIWVITTRAAFVAYGLVLTIVWVRLAAGTGHDGDPVPQALIITGLVVAFAATAIAVALLVRLAETSGRGTLDGDGPNPPAPSDEQA